MWWQEPGALVLGQGLTNLWPLPGIFEMHELENLICKRSIVHSCRTISRMRHISFSRHHACELGTVITLAFVLSNTLHQFGQPCSLCKFRWKQFIDRTLKYPHYVIDNPRSGVVYNFGRVCLSVCQTITLNLDVHKYVSENRHRSLSKKVTKYTY